MATNWLFNQFTDVIQKLRAIPSTGEGQAERDACLKALANLQAMSVDGRLAKFDYTTLPQARYGWGKPPHGPTLEFIERWLPSIQSRLERFSALAPLLSQVSRDPVPDAPLAPYWRNVWLPVIDAVSIVGMLEEFRPRKFIEIGSGNSTRFACMGVAALSLDCAITSIDAYPNTTVAAAPDVLIRAPLQGTSLDLFSELNPGDLVWLDGSHYSFSNTDVSVFFMEVLPRLESGVIVGVHDIPLPWDYPPDWNYQYYNELQMMGSFLIGAGDRIECLFPAFYVNCINKNLRSSLDPIWNLPAFAEYFDDLGGGGAFWFRMR